MVCFCRRCFLLTQKSAEFIPLQLNYIWRALNTKECSSLKRNKFRPPLRMVVSATAPLRLNPRKNARQIIGGRDEFPLSYNGFELSTAPSAQPVEGAERKVRRSAALSAHQFAAPPHIVNHPGRKTKMIGVAPNFPDVKRKRGN